MVKSLSLRNMVLVDKGDIKMKYKIISSICVDRIYEVEAKSKEEALEIYFEFDDRTKFIEEKEILDSDINIEEVD